MNTNKILEIQNLYVELDSIGKRIIDNVSLTVNEGEFVALAGESGSGKTMTALSCMNLLPSNMKIVSGKIFLENTELTALSQKEMRALTGKDISIIFQEPMTALNPLIKVGKQIEETGLRHGMNKIQAKERALDLMQMSGFSNPHKIATCYPHELSGGMRQRILIASSLMNNPKILIADEPTTALDVTTQEEILNIISSMNKVLHTSMLLITHNLDVVKKVCERIYVMHNGKIIESGNVKTVLTSPKENYTKALLDAIPSFSKRGKKLGNNIIF